MAATSDEFGSKYPLLGTEVNALTLQKILDAFASIIQEDKKKAIVCHNLHSAYLIDKHPEAKSSWQQAHITYIDSVPMVWWGQLLGYPLQRSNRITYFDMFDPFLALANKQRWKIFYLGSKPGVAEKAVHNIHAEYPDITFKTRHGFFNQAPHSTENRKVIDEINRFQPDILMVGMGMPRQEKWIAKNFEQLDANAIWGCGAGFDFNAGEQPIPPRFLADMGLDWFYRFLCDPRRLFKRYFIEPIHLIPLFFKEFKRHAFRAGKP